MQIPTPNWIEEFIQLKLEVKALEGVNESLVSPNIDMVMKTLPDNVHKARLEFMGEIQKEIDWREERLADIRTEHEVGV